ncbi:MAG: alpha/beta fold hydrolase [Actinobacteria bacterium]|nr:alpha/beta fold hydrolase [Actinomycetota bacterium]
MRSTVRYVRNGDVSLAYQVIGAGPIDLVFLPGFVSHLDLAWEEPFLAQFLEDLASFSRLIWFDKRGTGLSDPVESDAPIEQRVDDIRAVMDAAGSQRAALFGVSDGAALSALFAVAHPQRTSELVLWAGFTRMVKTDDDAPGWSPELFESFVEGLDQVREDGTGIELPNPTIAGDERYLDWFVRYVRAAAGPGILRRVMRSNASIDLRRVLDRINAPTLVLHRVDDAWVSIDVGRDLAARIPGATLIELPGIDHWPWIGDADAAVSEVEAFVTGVRRARRPRPSWGRRSLTRRELEVARLAADGLQAAEIAERLSIGERTVETHLANVYAKLGLSSKLELARQAATLGL